MPEQKKQSNLIRVNNNMIHDLKNNDKRKAVTVGLIDKDGNKRVGTIYVGANVPKPDPKTEHLAKSAQKSYIGISRDNDYDFVTSTKQEDGTYKQNTEKIKGADIIEQNHAYMKEKRASYEKNAEAQAEAGEKTAEAQAEGPEAG